jgi:hypothetical protein
MEHIIKHIESDLHLAIVFNKVISKITTLWIMTRPRIFDDTKGEEAAFKMMTYYHILLWENWLHEVVKRLQEWSATIDEYFNEFNGSWEYYALSKRLEFIDEFGTDDEEDYNLDGSIKTIGITREQLKFHTVFYDLYQDCVDIVQDTKPKDLFPLVNAIEANSRVSIIDILQKVSGEEVTAYTMGDDGHLRPVTFADRELHKVSEMVEAHDYGQTIMIVAMLMEQLTNGIETVAKSETAFGDNHDLLRTIKSDAEAILSLNFENTRYFKSSKTISYDRF